MKGFRWGRFAELAVMQVAGMAIIGWRNVGHVVAQVGWSVAWAVISMLVAFELADAGWFTHPEPPPAESFTCPDCGMTSHNPDDVRWQYCGNCHEFKGRS